MPDISREEAIAKIRDLQAQNTRSAEIRRQMMDHGFSFKEIYEMMGEDQYSYRQPKRKNDEFTYSYDDYGKNKNDFQYQQFERGGCLSAYLIVQVIGVVIVMLMFCASMAQLSSYSYGSNFGGIFFFAFLIVALVAGLQLMCIAWLWDGQRKGYTGLLILAVLGAGLNLLSGDIPSMVGSLIGLGILYALVNPKQHLLRD